MAAKPKPTKPNDVKAVSVAAPSPRDVVPKAAVAALKKKDLIDKVVQATGAKKSAVRKIIAATLAELGDALSNGVMLNLPPFGKAKVSRATDDVASGRAMTVKLRRSRPDGQSPGRAKPNQSLADAED